LSYLLFIFIIDISGFFLSTNLVASHILNMDKWGV